MSEPPLKAAMIPVTPLAQNCSLIWCTQTNRAAVVDPGGDLPKIHAAIAQAGVVVEKILITHGHIDHCGEAGALAAQLGVPIEGPHEADRFWIARLAEDGRAWGLRGESFEPDRWLVEGDTVTLGALELAVYHCPGHTPGHVVFHHAPSRLALVGDVLFEGSIGRTDFPMGDHAALIESIVTKLWPLGDDTVFIPGHGRPSRFGIERQTNGFVADRVLAG
ncbi:MAG: MBL fold metallo-hydrolase [Sphingomonas sp.]|uniref:MBL fold metallo-hydrolase n=1 Tax=Sphingomonas sp. TaxID=28214 RepID=UPI0025D0EC61|nr:MBL fold metallo-hydrolase [Sphingomonas sp.]MBX9880890.1 MBL fold metallo-hydrolase [Sphingomonas sp.]